MKLIDDIINGGSYRLKGVWGMANRVFCEEPGVLGTLDSLEILLRTGHSLSRYGDGEFKLMRGGGLGFQRYDAALASRLEECLQEPPPGLEVGIPDVFGSLAEYDPRSARFWRSYLCSNRRYICSMLDRNALYLNPNMTRFWTGYKKDLDRCSRVVEGFRALWEGRDVVFVEGEKTRMGVGNDLFANASSVRRILCPAEDAWGGYEEIFGASLTEGEKSPRALFILALGPTATVLARDLAASGLQALDLGHVDIQYEYYLGRAESRAVVRGKYVNEAVGGQSVDDSILTEEYWQSVIARVGH